MLTPGGNVAVMNNCADPSEPGAVKPASTFATRPPPLKYPRDEGFLMLIIPGSMRGMYPVGPAGFVGCAAGAAGAAAFSFGGAAASFSGVASG